jgi:hypothetical protein
MIGVIIDGTSDHRGGDHKGRPYNIAAEGRL